MADCNHSTTAPGKGVLAWRKTLAAESLLTQPTMLTAESLLTQPTMLTAESLLTRPMRLSAELLNVGITIQGTGVRTAGV